MTLVLSLSGRSSSCSQYTIDVHAAVRFCRVWSLCCRVRSLAHLVCKQLFRRRARPCRYFSQLCVENLGYWFLVLAHLIGSEGDLPKPLAVHSPPRACVRSCVKYVQVFWPCHPILTNTRCSSGAVPAVYSRNNTTHSRNWR